MNYKWRNGIQFFIVLASSASIIIMFGSSCSPLTNSVDKNQLAAQPAITVASKPSVEIHPTAPKKKSLFQKWFGPKEEAPAVRNDAVEVDLNSLDPVQEQAAVQESEPAQTEVQSNETPVNLKALQNNHASVNAGAPSDAAPHQQYAQRSDEQQVNELQRPVQSRRKSEGRQIKVGNVMVPAPVDNSTVSDWGQETQQTIADDEEQNQKSGTIGGDYPEKHGKSSIKARKYRVASEEKKRSVKPPKKIYARDKKSKAIVPVQIVKNSQLDAEQRKAQQEEAAAMATSNLDESEINEIVGNSTVPSDEQPLVERSSVSRGGRIVTRVSNISPERSAEGEDIVAPSKKIKKVKKYRANKLLVSDRNFKKNKNKFRTRRDRVSVSTADQKFRHRNGTIVRSDIPGKKSLLVVKQQPVQDPFDQIENLSDLPENSPLWNSKMVKNTELPETQINVAGVEPLSSVNPSLEKRWKEIAPHAALPALYEVGPGYNLDPAELDKNGYSVVNVLAANRYCNTKNCLTFTFWGTEPDAFWQHVEPAGENANVIWDLKAEGKAIATLTANVPVSTISTITVEPETCSAEDVKQVKLVLTQTNIANKWVISFDRGLAPEVRECVQKNIDGVTLLLGFDHKKVKQVENGLLRQI